MKSKIRFNDGGYEVEFKPHTWGQFACTSHTSWSYPDQGFNKAFREASPTPEEIVKAVNEHAALVAVASCAARLEQCTKDNFPHRSPSWVYDHPDTPIRLAMNNFLNALDKWKKLAAVRSGSEVAK